MDIFGKMRAGELIRIDMPEYAPVFELIQRALRMIDLIEETFSTIRFRSYIHGLLRLR